MKPDTGLVNSITGYCLVEVDLANTESVILSPDNVAVVEEGVPK